MWPYSDLQQGGPRQQAGEDQDGQFLHAQQVEAEGGQRQIWILKDGRPQPLTVTTGLSDGRRTEVSGEGLTEGAPVITGQASAAAGSAPGGTR